MGSAISLMACGSEPTVTEPDDEKIVSRVVRNMEWLSLENGRKDRLMRAPLREEHAFARPAFETFPEGVEVIGYDSLGQPSSRVVADYALHWTERDLWELNGNVVVEGEEGQKLYTQQLRWDRKIKKVYSNVDSKLEENGMPLYGVGFEAADDFSNWVFRGVTGTVPVEVKPTSDSTKVNSPEQSAGDPPEEIVKKVENTPKPAVPAPRRERPAKSLRREGDALRPMNVEPIKR
jgi:hypothetical protein